MSAKVIGVTHLCFMSEISVGMTRVIMVLMIQLVLLSVSCCEALMLWFVKGLVLLDITMLVILWLP